MVKTQALIAALDEWLEPGKVQDYCPNGLQVEGRAEVSRVLCGVTASEALIDQAIAWKADAILVHHGYFWKGESPVLTGYRAQRIRKLMMHGINLIAYHLPLDIHPQWGNNVRLAARLGWHVEGQQAMGGVPGLLWYGRLPRKMGLVELSDSIELGLDRSPLLLGGEEGRLYETIAWCTGGAQNYLQQAAALGVDAYLSGEASEQSYHEALELGLLYVGAGHHATERCGVMALAAQLEQQFGLTTRYEELANPV